MKGIGKKMRNKDLENKGGLMELSIQELGIRDG